jgi:hypothetical protein
MASRKYSEKMKSVKEFSKSSKEMNRSLMKVELAQVRRPNL